MIIVKPELVGDDVLTSNITEPDYSKGEIEWEGYRRTQYTGSISGSEYDFRVFTRAVEATRDFRFSTLNADYTVTDSSNFSLNAATGVVKSSAYSRLSDAYVALDTSGNLTFYDGGGTYVGTTTHADVNGTGFLHQYQDGFIFSKLDSGKVKYFICSGFDPVSFKIVGEYELSASVLTAGLSSVSIGSDYIAYYATDSENSLGEVYPELVLAPLLQNNPTPIFADSYPSNIYTGTYSFIEQKYYRDGVRYKADFETLDTAYIAGDTATVSTVHASYQCLVDGTLDRPDIGAAKETPTWLKLGSTNKYAMFGGSQGELNSFSGIISNQTESDSTVNVTLTYPVAINSVCGFNIENCATVEVTISGGTAYNETITLGTSKSFSLFGLSGTTVTLEFIPSSGTMKIGEVVAGQETALGESNFGGSLGLLDFSRVETDSFGNVSVTPRRKVKIIDYDVTIDTNQAEDAFNYLSEITTVPAVYAAESDFTGQALVAFAIYQDFRAAIESPEVSSYTLSVQGLV